MSRDPVFRNSRLAKMGSDNGILTLASRAHAQTGQHFLSKRFVSKADTADSDYFCFFSGPLTSLGANKHRADIWDKGLSNLF